MMMKRARISLAVTLFLLFVSSFARGAENQDVLRATLANGLRVVIVKNTLAPVVATQVNYLAGSNEAPDGFPGTAHALEHMMFRGSPGLSAAQLANIIALMGGNSNADTQQTVTRYYFTVPKDTLEMALHVEAIRMQGVLTSQEIWEEERGAIEQEVARDLSNPEYVLYMKLLDKMFAGTPYAHDALGTRPSFQKTTGAMLGQFFKSWYGPNNAILIIVGDVDMPKTLALVKKLFTTIPRRPMPDRPAINLSPPEPAAIVLDTDLPHGLSVVAYRLPGFESPDFAAGMILADVLGSKRGDLYSLVPQGKALFTGFDAEALPKAGFGFATAGFPEGGDGDGLVAAIKKIVDGYLKDGMPADLVEAAKRHEVSDAEFRKNSISGLADLWSQALAVEGHTSPDDDIEAISKVTVEDVNRVAREYLRNDRAITAVLTPRSSGKPVTAKGFRGGESFAPQQTTAVELPLWAKKALAVPPLLRSKVKPIDMKLANGIRLIVQPEKISPTITVLGQVKHNDNLQEPAGKEGVSDLLDSLFSYGTHSFDRIALQKAQDDMGAEIVAGTSFSLRVQPDNFERGMEILADDLLHPALPEAAFTVAKEQTISSLRGRLKSPAYLSGRALREGLFPANDPTLRETTPETVTTISPSDVRSYHTKVFRPDMTTIVVIGQVTAKQARGAVKRYFGAWKAAGAKPVTDLPPVPISRPSRSVIPDTSRVQDEVTLAETVGITRRHSDYYRLELGNQVLSGAAYASRLYRELREKSGLVYTVESSLAAGKHRALFSVVYGCDPPNVSKARAMVERNIREMQTTLVTAEELQRARILLLRQIPLAEASMEGIAARLLSRSIQDLPLEEPILAAKHYRKATAAQVRDAFRKWLRPADFVQVTEGPNPD
ncbi:MAG: pitrilysin family protein [Syntrophales bacterium]|nr:pitrilysin family protein [Syntrophales bacterium]